MLLEIIFLVVLILFNGLFSATEMAFFAVNKYELSKEIKNGNKKAKKIAHLLKDSSTFLSAIQIVITLSGFLASAFAAENFASYLSEVINISFISHDNLISILVVLITIILSYFTLVFGELVPKKIGLAYPKEIAFGMVNIITIVIKICKPFIFILKSSTNFIIKILKIKKKETNIQDELKSSITESNLEELEKEILLNVFEFNDTIVEKVMTPRENVVDIDINSSKEDVLNIIKITKYTRFPIKDGNKIIGVLNIKDFIIRGNGAFNLRNYIRPIKRLNYDVIIDDAFLDLNSHNEAIALVEKDHEYIGIITIEDIVEEIIGNIFDEYDKK